LRHFLVSVPELLPIGRRSIAHVLTDDFASLARVFDRLCRATNS